MTIITKKLTASPSKTSYSPPLGDEGRPQPRDTKDYTTFTNKFIDATGFLKGRHLWKGEILSPPSKTQNCWANAGVTDLVLCKI